MYAKYTELLEAYLLGWTLAVLLLGALAGVAVAGVVR